MTKEEYLINPYKKSSLPLWKVNFGYIPKHIEPVHHTKIKNYNLEQYHFEVFFRLIHSLDKFEKFMLPKKYETVLGDIDRMHQHINSSHQEFAILREVLLSYKIHSTYDPNLWIMIVDKETKEVVASGIAEFYGHINEGILEWIQVSPEYRNQGLGKVIVLELLHRLNHKSDFVTVSGSYTESQSVLDFYKRCGFKGDDLWYIIYKEKR